MIAEGVFKETDPKQLAIEFYAPFYLLLNVFDCSKGKVNAMELLKDHIERFIQFHATERRS